MNLNICIRIDDNIIYKFTGRMNEQIMIGCANNIEKLLLKRKVAKEKIQNIFELFIETIQNILNYSSNSVELKNVQKEVFCYFSLSYLSQKERYILESCNLIRKSQRAMIEERVNALKSFDKNKLRKLIRQKGRSKEDSHLHGAGLGYIMMTRKSSCPIEINFIPYQNKLLIYKQKLSI